MPPVRQRLESGGARALGSLPPRLQLRLSMRPPVRLDGLTLDPETQFGLRLLELRGTANIGAPTPELARTGLSASARLARGAPVTVGAVRELEVAGAAGPLAARHYAPDESGGPHPLLVFLHGGGFVAGDIDTHDAPCRVLCRHAGVHVLSVAYRLAPEHPFPSGVQDARAALAWAVEHAGELGADPDRVAIGGDSAGGNLSAVASQQAARDGGPAPALQLLIYPRTDMTTERASHRLFAEGFYLTRADMRWYESHYLGDGDHHADPRASPLRVGDLSGLAPAIVVTAGFDPLRDEGEAYAEALRAAGNRVVARRFGGQIHGFINNGIARSSRAALIEIAGATRALLAR